MEASRIRKLVMASTKGAAHICVLGSSRFQSSRTEKIAAAIGLRLERSLGPVTIITDGAAAVQETVVNVRSRESDSRVCHIISQDQTLGPLRGTKHLVGRTAEERRAVLEGLADVYLVIEGDAFAADVARAAAARGAPVLPVISTGGACCGMNNFPASALQCPSTVNKEHWLAISEPNASVEDIAAAVVKLLRELILQRLESTNGNQNDFNSYSLRKLLTPLAP